MGDLMEVVKLMEVVQWVMESKVRWMGKVRFSIRTQFKGIPLTLDFEISSAHTSKC